MAKKKASKGAKAVKPVRKVGRVKAVPKVKSVTGEEWTIHDAQAGRSIGVRLAIPTVKPKGASAKSIRKAVNSLAHKR